jgi:hypothetical protein
MRERGRPLPRGERCKSALPPPRRARTHPMCLYKHLSRSTGEVASAAAGEGIFGPDVAEAMIHSAKTSSNLILLLAVFAASP